MVDRESVLVVDQEGVWDGMGRGKRTILQYRGYIKVKHE